MPGGGIDFSRTRQHEGEGESQPAKQVACANQCGHGDNHAMIGRGRRPILTSYDEILERKSCLGDLEPGPPADPFKVRICEMNLFAQMSRGDEPPELMVGRFAIMFLISLEYPTASRARRSTRHDYDQ